MDGQNGQQPLTPAPAGTQPGELQLVVTMRANGAVEVSGPIGNLIVCMGVLELAKDALKNWHAHMARQQASQGVQLADAALLKKLR